MKIYSHTAHKRFFNKITTLLCTAILTFVVTSCSDREERVLTMGTTADSPPFEFYDTATDTKDPTGFDIELAREISQKMGYTLKIQDMDFSSLITALKMGRVDFLMANLTPSEERKKAVDFSENYYVSESGFLIHAENIFEKDPNGHPLFFHKTIGVQLGSLQEAYAKKLLNDLNVLGGQDVPAFKIKTLNKIGELVQELKSGRIDAIIVEKPTADGYLKRNPEILYLKNKFPTAGYAAAFKKGSEFKEAYNKALADLRASGKLGELIEKWFGTVK